MRRITIEVDCDWCGNTLDSEEEATNIEAKVGREIREFDLCEDCRTDFMTRSRRLRGVRTGRPKKVEEASVDPEVADFKAKLKALEPPRTKRQGATMSCPHCERDGLYPQGLALHLKAKHPEAFVKADYEGRGFADG